MGTGTVTFDAGLESGATRWEPQLILVLNAAAPLEPSWRLLLGDLLGIEIGRGSSCRIDVRPSSAGRCARVDLPDISVSARHALLTRVGDAWLVEDEGSKNGTLVDGQLADRRTRLASGAIIEIGPYFFLFKEAVVHDPRECLRDDDLVAPHRLLATLSGELAATFESLVAVARSDVPVLVLGETGVGKELVANALHEMSGRQGVFVPVHLAAYPESILGAELFGYRRGAFTGAAADRLGLVRVSHGGTLFLDEVGELPAVAQVALLRVLETREVHALGATTSQEVDLRLVAATNQDLDTLVTEGRFRSDLIARLSGLVLRLPRLADRVEDMGLLLRAILRRQESPETVRLTARAARALLLYDWPMNVRELEKACTTAVLLAGGGSIEQRHLPGRLRASIAPVRPAEPVLDGKDRNVVEALLRAHQGNVMSAARAAGCAPVQVYRWIRRHGIDLDELRLAAGGGR
jgi:DNA-binding NtrC family response regulator